MFKNKIITSTKEIHVISEEDIHLQPASKFIPQWFKDMPGDINNINESFPASHKKLIPNSRTVKMCPSFSDVFSQGYVLVAPCDIWLSVTDKEWHWKVPNPDKFQIDIHSEEQYINHVDNNVKMVFKYVNSIRMFAPKGYSIWQMPMHHHYDINKDWYVPYGIIDIDIHHEVNPQIFYISDSDEVLIKKGTPLCYYVPFKRDDAKIKFEMKPYTKELEKKDIISSLKTFSRFKRGYTHKRKDNR